MIQLKRCYDEPSKRDGLRILVERLWPRGVSKGKAAVDLWLKELAPSSELRKWFNHDPEKWGDFCKRYWSELEQKGDECKCGTDRLVVHQDSFGPISRLVGATKPRSFARIVGAASLRSRHAYASDFPPQQ